MLVVLETSKVARSVAPLGTVCGCPVGGRVPIAVRGVKVPCGAAGMEDGGSREEDYAGEKSQGWTCFHSHRRIKMRLENPAISQSAPTDDRERKIVPVTAFVVGLEIVPFMFTSAPVDRESLKKWRRCRRLRFDFRSNRSFCICLAGQRRGVLMCRNIKTLYNFEPPATEEEIRASSLQYVRKLSGFAVPFEGERGRFRPRGRPGGAGLARTVGFARNERSVA